MLHGNIPQSETKSKERPSSPKSVSQIFSQPKASLSKVISKWGCFFTTRKAACSWLSVGTCILELIWVRAYTLLTPHTGNHLQFPYLLAHLHASNNSKKFKYGKNRLNILDLKILQVFFTNRGEILILKKCWISWVFWFYFTFQDILSKKDFLKNFSDW